MKSIYMAALAAIAIPSAAYAAEATPEKECCCCKHEGKDCCCDEMKQADAHGAHGAPSHGPRA